ncbi:cupin domain-containing protein [Pseudonocardia sp. CA-107938]|uniref:cupin domain-containing protein n=1 Tax=Pseudonocardia sp. CA-107938 TaxID=3240021 RepID=UPI003D8ECADE
MRVLDRARSASIPKENMEFVRWEQFGLDDALPFGAMWYTVAPQTTSPRDVHVEAELSIVLSGRASVEVGGTVTDVEQGDAFLLDGDEPHIVHNRSDVPLVIFSAYWDPTRPARREAAS